MMLTCAYMKLCILLWSVIGYFIAVNGVPRLSPSLELIDEIHDAEIYKAVVSSMNEWQRRQNFKKKNNRIKREESTRVCYKDLGCFEASGPFGYLDTLPAKPEEINTKFLLYPGHSRRRSGSPPAEVNFFDMKEAYEWAKQGFNKTLSTKVLIHGFGSGCSHIWIYEMRSALMAVDEVNVICVDWENGAILPNYVKAAANTRLVGKQLALLLKGLVKHNGLDLSNTHLIGFSLGAHVAGFTGAEMGNLSRITGLDPAGPLFESQDPRARLDLNDAGFVDVIHSNGDNLILGGLGSYQPMGHVDFYPNGGRMQKGCSNIFVGALSDIIWSSAVEGRSLCNHRRAYKFFTDSVSPRCHFPAFPCASYEDFLAGKCFPCDDERTCGNMGYYADRSKGRGQLYLITRDEEPFCAYQYLVKIDTSPSEIAITSYGKIQITLVGDSSLNETFMMTRKEDEEMKLGQSISRILVPHPILQEPTGIQILYTAYSGWLSSGLTQWKIDKVTLSDSFGKKLSVCKKNLVLESGVPITLPLYPGECNVPNESFPKEAQNRYDDENEEDNKNDTFNLIAKETSNFIPTQIIKVGKEILSKETSPPLSLKDAIDILNIPWNRGKDNSVENEAESSRAFNTRIIKASETDKDKADADGLIREIVEPILKPHSSKNARSHNLDKDKPEITEPILGPTTSKGGKNVGAFTMEPDAKSDLLAKVKDSQKEVSYNFYDIEGEGWVPKTRVTKSDKWKREEIKTTTPLPETTTTVRNNPLGFIATTVQILPQRLARMFEQAEKYARQAILPLVSNYTPRFLTEIINPRPRVRYVPLTYEEGTEKTTSSNANRVEETGRKRKKKSTTTKPVATTPYTHIQKIKRKGEKAEVVYPFTAPTTAEIADSSKEVARRTRDDSHVSKSLDEKARGFVETTTTNTFSIKVTLGNSKPQPKKRKAIYIDLPVFDTNPQTKYIPLSFPFLKN